MLSMVNKSEGEKSTDYNSTVKELMHYHFPKYGFESPRTRRNSRSQDLIDDDVEFSQKNFQRQFLGLSIVEKRRCEYGLSLEVLEVIEILSRANKPLFLRLMNKRLKDGIFPPEMKVGDLVLFNKEGKGRLAASSYRPICLMPIWSQVFDKLVTNRLVHHS